MSKCNTAEINKNEDRMLMEMYFPPEVNARFGQKHEPQPAYLSASNSFLHPANVSSRFESRKQINAVMSSVDQSDIDQGKDINSGSSPNLTSATEKTRNHLKGSSLNKSKIIYFDKKKLAIALPGEKVSKHQGMQLSFKNSPIVLRRGKNRIVRTSHETLGIAPSAKNSNLQVSNLGDSLGKKESNSSVMLNSLQEELVLEPNKVTSMDTSDIVMRKYTRSSRKLKPKLSQQQVGSTVAVPKSLKPPTATLSNTKVGKLPCIQSKYSKISILPPRMQKLSKKNISKSINLGFPKRRTFLSTSPGPLHSRHREGESQMSSKQVFSRKTSMNQKNLSRGNNLMRRLVKNRQNNFSVLGRDKRKQSRSSLNGVAPSWNGSTTLKSLDCCK